MSFAAPWALLGLLVLPFIWWLHKKLRRPPEVELPSLLFLEAEAEARALPRGRRLDAELLLALAGAALLAFAAAGPRLEKPAAPPTVRVVVSGGGPADHEGYLAAVREVLRDLRAQVGDAAQLDVIWLPEPMAGFFVARPSDEALLGAAGAGQAAARVVVSDRPAPAELGSVRWVSCGRADVQNTGIVSVAVASPEGVPELFVTLAHQGPRAVQGLVRVTASRRLVFAGGSVPFALEPGAYASVRLPLGDLAGGDVDVGLEQADGEAWDDDLMHDDDATLVHGPLGVRIHADLPPLLASRLRHALAAALGAQGFDERARAQLSFVPRGSPETGFRLELQTLAEGAPATHAPAGVDAVGRDPLVRDLSTAGIGWVYAEGAERLGDGELLLLGRRAGETLWPVLARKLGRVRLAVDPLRGEPRPIDTPFWPLLIQNLVRAAGDVSVGGGYRAHGLLHPRSSELGTVNEPLAASTLTLAPPPSAGASRSLQPLLIVAALACLALLWAAPRLRRRLAVTRARPRAGARLEAEPG